MIRVEMIDEIQELKLSGYSFREVLEELRRRHTKVPCEKTLRKYYNMDAPPQDSHARLRKEHAFDTEPFRSEVLHILAENPGCYMSSVYDVLVEKYVESGMYEILPGNEQTLRNYIRHLRATGQAGKEEDRRRRYDAVETPPPGKKAQIDFGQVDCGSGLVVHFICILLWHSRLLGVYAQDHRYSSEEACRAIHRFTRKRGGRVEELVIDQDSVFITKEVFGEIFETATFKAFLEEQDMRLWMCRKADPESKGCVENAVGYVKKRFFSARKLSTVDEVQRSLPSWTERANSRIHQGTYKVPQKVFEETERAALRPMLPGVYEAAPLCLKAVPVGSQPYVLYRAVKYSVPWDMCYTTAYIRAIGTKLHIYDAGRRHVCTHGICTVKGTFVRLDEHRKEPASDWLDIAERMRRKWNCVEFQHFVNGFKKENQERSLGRQLGAVERHLDSQAPDRALVAEAISICCRDWRYTYTQFKEVFDQCSLRHAAGAPPQMPVGSTLPPEGGVATRDMRSYQEAFDSRCAS